MCDHANGDMASHEMAYRDFKDLSTTKGFEKVLHDKKI